MALWVISSGRKQDKPEQSQNDIQVRQPGDHILAQTQMGYVDDPYDEYGNLRQ